jgi:hypothetical protein
MINYIQFNPIQFNPIKYHYDVGNICCSSDNELIPLYALNEGMVINEKLYYSSKIIANSIRTSTKKISALRNYNDKWCSPTTIFYSPDNITIQYGYGYISVNNEIVLLAAINSSSIIMAKLLSGENFFISSDHIKILVNSEIFEYKKLTSWIINKGLLYDVRNYYDVIMTNKIQNYCFIPYQFKIKIKTVNDLEMINQRIKNNLMEISLTNS